MPVATCDLSALLAAATLDPSTVPGPARGSCCTHSVAACALHRTAAGWGVTFLAAPLPRDSWGRCLPEMRACLRRLPGFPAGRLSDAPAPSFQVLQADCSIAVPHRVMLGHQEATVLSRVPTASPLQTRLPACLDNPFWLASCHCSRTASGLPDVRLQLLRDGEDRALAALAARAGAPGGSVYGPRAPEAAPARLCVDFGWELRPEQHAPLSGGEEGAAPAPEFYILFYDSQARTWPSLPCAYTQVGELVVTEGESGLVTECTHLCIYVLSSRLMLDTFASMLQQIVHMSASPYHVCVVQGQEVQSVSSQVREAEGVTALAEPPPAPDEAPSDGEGGADARAPKQAAGAARTASAAMGGRNGISAARQRRHRPGCTAAGKLTSSAYGIYCVSHIS